MNALLDDRIPASAGIAIEYNIPLTNRRVDFILTGKDYNRNNSAIIVELKQWEKAEVTKKDAIVRTYLGKGIHETNHPSYQAWSYAALIEDYNETVRNESIMLIPCAYLHNMKNGDAIHDSFYENHTNKAPAFIKHDAKQLSKFLSQYIKYGDSDDIMYRIENGVIKPSKNLAESLSKMIQGKSEFLMIDEQKLVYETAIDLAYKSDEKSKKCLIVKGGPGTGKSVVAINLLVEFTNRELMTQYVSRNSAPREVFKKKLTGTRKKTHIDNLFKGSGSYINTPKNTFSVLLVDEAHRLNERSGMYQNMGESQIKEIMNASLLSIFFIDEAQRVTLKDVGTVEEIRRRANECNIDVLELELSSQFRCNGSDGYLAWLDYALEIRTTANMSLEDIDYDFRVFDNPNDLREIIQQKNHKSNKARIVAGYCWPWKSKNNSDEFDIIFPDFDFKAQWNLNNDGMLWAIADESCEQIGCIHTCQGLEFDYVGVIVGDDLIIRDGKVITCADKRASQDSSIRGYKKLKKKDPEKANILADIIIKNTYRTLMTRGQKGCYIFSNDLETRNYFNKFIPDNSENLFNESEKSIFDGLNLPVVCLENANPYETHVPVYDLKIAAGQFSDSQTATADYWVELPDYINITPGLFVSRVVGESMNKRIPNGSWCLFRSNPGGSRQGKLVIVQHRDIEDPDYAGSFTIKQYNSEKVEEYGQVVNSRIVLKPLTNAFGYKNIILDDKLEDLKVIGEFLTIL